MFYVSSPFQSRIFVSTVYRFSDTFKYTDKYESSYFYYNTYTNKQQRLKCLHQVFVNVEF